MTELLRNKVGEFVTKNAIIDSWESAREYYGAYTYVTFLCISALKFEVARTWKDVRRIAEKHEVETQAILEEISSLDDVDKFVCDVLDIISGETQLDIECLYQDYLSVDFMLKDGKVVFEEGKNSRDVLGSYYTHDEFAEIITRKAFKDYFCNNVDVKKIRVVDYSCGGATFLMAALKVCSETGLPCEIIGYDVDPVAVLISRVKIHTHRAKSLIKVRILLGNPLLPKAGSCVEKFRKALAGRYYNTCMGIDPINEADIILGNPPWEKIRFEEKKFLHHFFPNAEVGTKTQREKLLENASVENKNYYMALLSDYEASKKLFKKSELFKKSSCGEINTYALFTELSEEMLKKNGIAAIIIKSSLVKMPVYKEFFCYLLNDGILYDIYMFTNRNKIFNIDSREEFSVIYMSNGKKKNIDVALNLADYNDFDRCAKITLTGRDLSLINPETGMMPNIKSTEDLKFLIDLAKKNKTFGEIYSNCRYGRLVHLTNHSDVIIRKEDDGYLPIYEGKFIEQYTGKYASFKGMTTEDKYKNKATAKLIENPQGDEYPESRFFIESTSWEKMAKNFSKTYIVAWRSLTSATNRRTMLATILPLIPTCQSIQLLQLDDTRQMLHLVALFDSIVFDYIVRLKMVGLDLTQTIIKQIPVPKLEKYEEVLEFKGKTTTISNHILSRLQVLYDDDARVRGVFEEFDTYDITKERKEIIAEIDCLVGYLYGLNEETIKTIARTFDAFYTDKEVTAYF